MTLAEDKPIFSEMEKFTKVEDFKGISEEDLTGYLAYKDQQLLQAAREVPEYNDWLNCLRGIAIHDCDWDDLPSYLKERNVELDQTMLAGLMERGIDENAATEFVYNNIYESPDFKNVGNEVH